MDLIGNLNEHRFTEEDLLEAIYATHDRDIPAPAGLDPALIEHVVGLTEEANREANRDMSYGATLAWAITIGVLAERNRVTRLAR